jgi:hypothetical protein
MRALRCLCCLAVTCVGLVPAESQQQTSMASVADTKPTVSSAPAPATGMPGAVAAERLPEDVDPNPPHPEELEKTGMTWTGEYEMDKLNRPILDVEGNAIPVLYDKKGHRVHMTAKVPKPHPASIVAGVLTVDGWIGKAELNYEIRDLRYLYISAPPFGTMVISSSEFPGSTEVKGAFTPSGLDLKMDDHEVLLETKRPILHEKSAESAWVKVDKTYLADRRSPVLGYGAKLASPYQWPGARVAKASDKGYVPALPENMRPKMAQPVCSASKPCRS